MSPSNLIKHVEPRFHKSYKIGKPVLREQKLIKVRHFDRFSHSLSYGAKIFSKLFFEFLIEMIR